MAILCNHQRTVSRAQATRVETARGKITTLKRQLEELKTIEGYIETNEPSKIPLRQSSHAMDEQVQEAATKARKLMDTAETEAEKSAATQADQDAKRLRRDLMANKFDHAHLWENVPAMGQVKKRISMWEAKVSKMDSHLKLVGTVKEVLLEIPPINYMDPRITVAWCKRNHVPIDNIFSRVLQDKFQWAMEVTPEWQLTETPDS